MHGHSFMVTGLYGVISYVVVDTQKVAQAVEAVVSAVLQVLIAALLAYLAAKKAARKFLEAIAAILKQFAFAIQQLATLILYLAIGLVLLGTLILAAKALAPALAGGAVVLGTAAAVAILVLVIAGAAQAPSKTPTGGRRSVSYNGDRRALRPAARPRDFATAVCLVAGASGPTACGHLGRKNGLHSRDRGRHAARLN
jgi:hypothetical protein